MGFVGRHAELAELTYLLDSVRRGGRADRGAAITLRGRRRVGKSRLVTEFALRAAVPHVYFQAARGALPDQEFAAFAEAIATSTLPGAAVAADNRPTTLTATLRLLAAALPDDGPSIVVIDEAPWLLEAVPGGAGELQRAWDSALAAKPVLLLLLGSDLAMMERLSAADQPFHGRSTPMVLEALSPRDVGRMTGLEPFDAFDAYLITGGLPLVAQEWQPGMTRDDFLHASLARSTSALVVSGTRVLDAEFPDTKLARPVLSAIGARGERTFTRIHDAIHGGSASNSSVLATLRKLEDKRVVAADEPLSARDAHKDRRWRIADPSLRFWLAFVEPALGEVDRGRPDLAMRRVTAGYQSWRGRAIEPVVRGALERLLPDQRWPDTARIGGWWPRTNTPEIDIVGADGQPARHISFVGAIKWREADAITRGEIADLAGKATAVPGVTAATPLVAVTGRVRPEGTDLASCWTAEDLLNAWP